jgi:hypothetical protein
MQNFYCKTCDPRQLWSRHRWNPTLECDRCDRLPLYDAVYNHAPDAVILAILQANKYAAKLDKYATTLEDTRVIFDALEESIRL